MRLMRLKLESTIPAIMETWTRADFNGTAQWLGELEPSSARDQAVATFAPLVAKEDPRAAFQWGVTVDDQDLRMATLEKVTKRWLTESPENVADAIREATLEDADRPISCAWLNRMIARKEVARVFLFPVCLLRCEYTGENYA